MLLKGSRSNTRALLAMSQERVSHKRETQKRSGKKNKEDGGVEFSDIQVNDSFQGVAHIFNGINGMW